VGERRVVDDPVGVEQIEVVEVELAAGGRMKTAAMCAYWRTACTISRGM